MVTDKSNHPMILRDLGDGLVLRRATLKDSQALVAFNSRIHSEEVDGKPNDYVGAWTRDLDEVPHPTFSVGDFTVVEDTRKGEIVSTMNLISQTWSYSGVEFKVGRPELVGTHPDYRKRGLVRAQFEIVHQWSAERGELLQAITGIPYYYRLFGYEMALNLSGGRAGYKPLVPKLKEGETESYHLRPATEGDLSFINNLYAHGCRRSLVSCRRDEAIWRYELLGRSKDNVNRSNLCVIETPQGEAVGFLAHPPFTWGAMMAATAYELMPGISWAAVTPSVIRYLQAIHDVLQPEVGEKEEFGAFGFWLGAEHPVYQVITDKLPRVREPYAWYLRVPDLPAFLRRIIPVLDDRLANSPMSGHTGELNISFYNSGLRLVFEAGQIKQIEGWNPTPQGHSGDAAFPGLTFLQLLFGYRSLDELHYAFVDSFAGNDIARALLNCLFPKQSSNVWAVS
jgi:hypothetical protein